jgi:hypothetical protein
MKPSNDTDTKKRNLLMFSLTFDSLIRGYRSDTIAPIGELGGTKATVHGIQ